MISHKVAANFLAETEISFALLPFRGGVHLVDSAFSAEVGDFELVIQVGTGVVDPPLFPTRIALLNLYFWTTEDDEDDEDDEFPLFLTLQCCRSLLFASMKLLSQSHQFSKMP